MSSDRTKQICLWMTIYIYIYIYIFSFIFGYSGFAGFFFYFNSVYVALCGWATKADDSFVCFGAKPDKGFLDLKSRRIRKWEGDANESWLEKGAEGQLTLDSREASSRELAWNHGQGQSTPDSGDSSREDRVQRQ